MPDSPTIDSAAGGLLESREDGTLRIALIHRDRYDDWTLPKGHLEAGETLAEAALREVEEETACVGEIIEIVRPIAYLINGRPKIVVYYRMALAEHRQFTPNEEVSAVIWLTPVDALAKLSYAVEQGLIAEVYSV